MYSFPNFKPAHCPKSSSNCCFFTYIRFLRRQVRWSGIPISWRIFHNLLWSTWSKPLVYSQWSRSRCFSVIPLFFSMIQQMLAIWSLVPLPFLNPASTSGSSQLMHWWNLAWRILNTTLLAWKWVQLCSSLNILWHCLSLGLEWQLPFSVLWPLLSFPNLLHVECRPFTASSFRIWTSSAGIPSSALALWVTMLPKACLKSHLGRMISPAI